MTRISLGVLALLLRLLGPASADEPGDVKAAEIRRLIEITGVRQIADQVQIAATTQLVNQVQKSRPNIGMQTLALIRDEISSAFSSGVDAPGGLIEQISGIYARHFDTEDIRGLIAFYETPLGRKTIAVMPAVMGESMVAGQRWAQSLEPEIQRRVIDALSRQRTSP